MGGRVVCDYVWVWGGPLVCFTMTRVNLPWLGKLPESPFLTTELCLEELKPLSAAY